MEQTLDLKAHLGDFLGNSQTAIERDLKLNLQKLMTESNLEEDEALWVMLSLSARLKNQAMRDWARTQLQKRDQSEDLINEAEQAGALMSMMNLYYRFRHSLQEGQGDERLKGFGPAQLRMNAMSKPQLGKKNFEMLAFAHSVLNGCQMCINAHDKTLEQIGVPIDKIHDLARLTAVAKSWHDLSQGEQS